VSKVKTYKGEKADVCWDGRLCIHIGECGRAKNELFVGGRDPWCDPNVVGVDDVVSVVKRCPTGALSYAPKGELEAETPAPANRVVVANNGPLYVQGELEIDGAAEDMPGTKFRAALCRCGLSSNKPFCDNTHEKEGFVDRGAIGETGPGFEGEPGGLLQIRRASNGPLLLGGKVTLTTASGRVAWKGEKAALCRCGQSKNKPFCDGSHKAAGFEAE
jgi:CDGSH-type Zn-finger protein/uncharacterized Fe-S cluster protein YjdI